jgi:hypothetical protein
LPIAAIGLIFIEDCKEEALLTIVLDHTIVPARDKEESARFFARIFGLEYQGPVSHFAPVRINETLTIDFDNWESFERHHYAFKVSEAVLTGSSTGFALKASPMVAGRAPRKTWRSIIAIAAAASTSATRTVIFSRC